MPVAQITANDPRNPRVKCPYFHHFTGVCGKAIVCAGIMANSETKTTFISEEELNAHLEICCNTMNYMDCPLAEAIYNMGVTE